MNQGKKILLVVALLAAPLKVVRAEAAGPYSIGFNLNWPTPAGNSTALIKNGFGWGLDFGYRKESSPLGIRFDMMRESFDLTSTVLKQINFADSGWGSVTGFDLSLLLTAPNANHFRPYLQFGPGIYYEHLEASRFAGGGGVVCDPWFGCYNYNNTEDVADFSTWRGGWIAGGGLNMEFEGGGAMFLQAQYHYIINTKQDLEIIPIAIGYRQSF